MGVIHGSYLENGTDEKHAWYNFQTELQYAINDFLNIYLYNYTAKYQQPRQQLTRQSHYLTIVHTTTRLLESTYIDVNKEYAKHIIIDIYAQAEKKPRSTPPWQHKFIVFMIQYHATRTKVIMKNTGLLEPQINQAYEHFDEKNSTLFNAPNVRNLTKMHQQGNSDNEEDQDEDEKNDDYDVSRQSA
eukprot:1254694-Amphidinium_carterae.1